MGGLGWFGIRIGMPLSIPMDPFILGDPFGIQTTNLFQVDDVVYNLCHKFKVGPYQLPIYKAIYRGYTPIYNW